jgi:putative NADPH-quinone reductase
VIGSNPVTHAHIVVNHPEPWSFNAHFAEVARRTLVAKCCSNTDFDLCQSDFDPLERASYHVPPLEAARFDAQAERRHASAEKRMPASGAAKYACPEQAGFLRSG